VSHNEDEVGLSIVAAVWGKELDLAQPFAQEPEVELMVRTRKTA